MKNQDDNYGNMGDYMTSNDRMSKHNRRRERISLVKILGGVLILSTITGIGIGTYKLVKNSINEDYANSLKTPNFQDETVYERRVKLLNQAEKQLINTKNPNDAKGIMSLIDDIEKGKYDYQK